MPSFRALFAESKSAIPDMLFPLFQSDIHPHLQRDLITTLLNLCLHDDNCKKLIAEDGPMGILVFPLVIDALKSSILETRSNAAAALCLSSDLDLNKEFIGKLGALKPLIDLFEEGQPLATRNAASAIFNLCIVGNNKEKALGLGVVKVLVKKIKNGMYVDESVSILSLLSNLEMATNEMRKLGAVPYLFNIITERVSAVNNENSALIRESSSAVNAEKSALKLDNCLFTLYNTIWCSNGRNYKEISDEENSHKTFSRLAQNWSPVAQKFANTFLEILELGIPH
ncbi:U-box domain-containing protein 9-like [Cornus florida]|uniref:U-box domain-containing protein 9-like n=1 Tax=Cornus florida TaxID=4283 RepID=UPI0028A00D8D|nr:U-box domain-containing protein 9-like [Cornus florida]